MVKVHFLQEMQNNIITKHLNNMKYKVIETRKATMVFEYEVEAPSEEQAVQLANEYVTPYNAYVNVDEGEEFDMEVEPWNDDIE